MATIEGKSGYTHWINSSAGVTIETPTTLVDANEFRVINQENDHTLVTFAATAGATVEIPGVGSGTSVQCAMPGADLTFVYAAGSNRWRMVTQWPSRNYGTQQQNFMYPPQAMVLDAGYLSYALRQTDEKSAPYGIGDRYNIRDLVGTFPDPPPEQEVTAASLIVGQRYTFQFDLIVDQVEFYIPDDLIGFNCALYVVLNPTTAPDIQTIVSEFTIGPNDVDQWVQWRIGNQLVQEATEFDLLALFLPTVGENTFGGDWQYKRDNGTPSADSGEVFHQSGQSGRQRWSRDDATGTSRDADFANLHPGAEIEGAGITWTILSVEQTGYGWEIYVDPATRAQENDYTFSFRWYGVLPIKYIEVPDYYVGNPGIQGFFSTDGYNPDPAVGITLNQNAYGVDMRVQEAVLPDDWFKLADPVVQQPGTGVAPTPPDTTKPFAYFANTGQPAVRSVAAPVTVTLPFVWSALVKIDSAGVVNGTNYTVLFYGTSNQQNYIGMQFRNDGAGLYARILSRTGGGAANVQTTAAGTIPADTEFQYTLQIITSGNIQLWIDKTPVSGINSVNTPVFDGTERFTVGRFEWATPAGQTSANIGDVQYYQGTTWIQSDIDYINDNRDRLVSGNGNIPASDAQIYWPGNEGTGTQWLDGSGNNLNGEIVGTIWTGDTTLNNPGRS